LLVFAVGKRDGVGDVAVVELCESEEEVEVGFVGVVCLGWGVAVWDEEAAPPG
jgi:hypothetical protein